MELWITIVAVAVAIASPILAWWGSSKFFLGAFGEWKRSSEEWRKGLGVRLDQMEDAVTKTGLLIRVVRNEKDILDLRGWKHEQVEPYIRAVEVLKERVDKLEDK
jgi:hypothetical protein